MSEFLRETLLNIIETDHVQCGEASALARMALAAMDSEPVAWTWHYREQWHVTNDSRRAEFVAKDGDVAVLPLYRHAHPAPLVSEVSPLVSEQPAPIVQPMMFIDGDISSDDADKLAKVIRDFNEEDERPLAKMARIIRENPHPTNECDMPKAQPAPVVYSDFESFWSSYIHPLAQDDELKGFAWDIWCAAMLQAGTLTNEDTKQAWTGIPDIDNAINTLDRIDTLESCDDDRIEAVKTVLRGLAGNSPVITDSSADMLRRWLAFGRGMQNAGSQLPHNLIAETESMLAAAPQSPGIEPATVPGKWIAVSERMPIEFEAVIAFDGDQVYGEAMYSSDDGFTIDGYEPCDRLNLQNVTHWMPLPAAPQEVNHG
ncbi:TPA: DUF551 domain-containing protein [Klebsiella pneumoniae]|uniref:DUF551 domain-containing protein n=4 Tax=Klebsiella/Raoultella group TaxID=2890311 RepID=UPI0004466DB7|nr:DUF551 domain-containing protein [Klebsiella pneumoniae]APQ27769.1 hypothetical protein BB745_04042 [Klebsiella pneumoniae]EWF38596.1 hypothetical protein L395_09550 [Klebsiella pneumoniae BWH 2]MCD5628719.1 DUF551 domain-containing protein [Klebsiella pneumoniae]MCD5686725.1 DUF551 domain-containing protein [Klebsiella pneumoniae]MCD5907849.1 DUF551 domain-containing protein [Klebsiella pneumoniae]